MDNGKIIFIIFFILASCSTVVNAQQNFISNGDFSLISRCPNAEFDFICAKDWQILRGTPDLFNICVPDGKPLSIPHNFHGTRSSFSGDSYAGIVLLMSSGVYKKRESYSVDEGIYNRLAVPISVGKRYKLSFMVSLSDSSYFCTDSIFCSFSPSTPIKDKPIDIVVGKWNRFKKSDDYGISIKYPCRGCWNKVELHFVAKMNYVYFGIGLPRNKYKFLSYLKDISMPVRNLSKDKWEHMSAYYYLSDIQIIEEIN